MKDNERQNVVNDEEEEEEEKEQQWEKQNKRYEEGGERIKKLQLTLQSICSRLFMSTSAESIQLLHSF